MKEMNERMLPAICRASLLAKEGAEMRRIDVVNHLLSITLRRKSNMQLSFCLEGEEEDSG